MNRTVLISLKNQVRSQVEAWLPYTIAQRRLVRGGLPGLFGLRLQALQVLAQLTGSACTPSALHWRGSNASPRCSA